METELVTKHPSSEMLINYAMGNLNEAESLIIAGHLTYCKECKRDVSEYESMAGSFLYENEKTEVSDSLFTKVLDAIETKEQSEKKVNYIDSKIKSSLENQEIRVPSFILKYLGSKCDTSQWNTAINNVRYTDLEFGDIDFKGKFLEIPPGKSMPRHGHEGSEATLVMHGGYRDESGHYNKGDLVLANDSHVHSPIASEETGCLCLVIYSGSIKFKGIIGSILNLSKF